MARNTYLKREVEVEYEIDINDVLEFINDCNDDEKKLIKDALKFIPERHIKGGNLYDDIKISYLNEIFDKYSLDQLKDLAKKLN